jgi:L-ascorbate metabolism protein UlaG (beta-lactamase superfamily)
MALPLTPASRIELAARTADAGSARGSIHFVGTATVILEAGGFTILTDPNFLHKGEHVHLGFGLTSERLTEPALDLDSLPEVDFIVLSHFHEDHFDRRVQQKLDRDIPIVSTGSAVEHLHKLGFRNLHALERWHAFEALRGGSTVRVTAMPARHGPAVAAVTMPETMGSMLEFSPTPGATACRIYISGDTLVFNDIREIAQRYRGIDIALLHLGGTRVMGVLVTMDAEAGVEAMRMVRPQTAIPIHYDDYDVFKSSADDFLAAARKAGLEETVRVVARGDTYRFDIPGSRLA